MKPHWARTTWGRRGLFAALYAVCAATQDAVIDTVAILGVPAEQRGSLSGFMQAGMLGARALFGGGALWMASQWGERTVIALLIVAIGCPK